MASLNLDENYQEYLSSDDGGSPGEESEEDSKQER